jgi:hypothetical protein
MDRCDVCGEEILWEACPGPARHALGTCACGHVWTGLEFCTSKCYAEWCPDAATLRGDYDP